MLYCVLWGRKINMEVKDMDIENSTKKGGISVETAHIFPIIKKWLYSEKDIFLREIVSNATDAVTKLRRLSSLGQYDGDDEVYSVRVVLDKSAKTLTVSDNGIGMTEEELEKYICSIALSGALDFIQKYDDGNDNGIIGHFGLGFYSSFMVSDKVELVTRSYNGDGAIHWVCNGSGEYEITNGERDTHGTDVIMHISDEDVAYLEAMGLDPDEYMILNFEYFVNAYYNSTQHSELINTDTLSKRYIATEIFTREELGIGSVIRITKAGYQYRPDAWTALDKKTSGRPGNVTEEAVIVTEEWWGNWNYRAFNISKTVTSSVSEDDVSALKIYVKVK